MPIELLDRNEVILLLSPHRWQAFEELVALGARSLPPVARPHSKEVGTVLYVSLVFLNHQKVVEEQELQNSFQYRLTQKGAAARQSLIKSFCQKQERESARRAARRL